MLTCRCQHLSVFGGSIFVAPNKVDPINDIELFVTVFNNPYIAVIVILCLILYVILFIWAWRKDKQDDSYAKLILLKDNIVGDSNAYVVVVYTGIRIAAGTTSNVGIQIFGSDASSRVHILKGVDEDREVLRRASDDWFLLFTSSPLGKLEKIHIWIDFSGSNPSWYCSKIVIIDVANGDEYIFMVGKWLTILTNNGELELLWNCAPSEKTRKRAELAQFNTIYGFREGHAWSAVFNRHPRSPITRKERLSVTLCFLLNTMLLSLMFYGAARGTNMDYPTYTLRMRDIMISVQSMVISIPVSLLIVYCFKKSRGKLDKVRRERRKGGGCCGFILYHVTRLFEGFLTFKPLQAVVVSTEVEKGQKSRVWFLLGWSLCVFFILLDSYLIILYSLKFGRRKSLNWLTAVTLGQFQGTFIFEPVKVTLFAVLLAVIFRKQPRVGTYKIKELKPEEMASSDVSPTIRNSDEYKPPSKDRVQKLKQTYLPYWEQKWLLFNLILTLIIIMLCGVVIHQIGNTRLYYNTSHITEMLTAPKAGTIAFKNVTNSTEFYEYVKKNLLPALYLKSCYNETAEIPFTSDCFNHLVKIPQIRQRRVVRGLCRVPEILKNVTDQCQALLSDETEDKATYEYSWLKRDIYNLNQDVQSPWKYEEAEKYEYPEQHIGETETTVPVLSGYTAKLDQTLQTSVEKLTYLKNNNWIDALTRELFVEFILYNANTDMYCLVRLQVIHPATGVYQTRIHVNSLVIDLIRTNPVVMICFFCVACLVLLLAWRALSNLLLYGFFEYATRPVHIWEFCSAVTGLFYIFWFSIKYLEFFMYSEHTKQSFQKDYIPFSVIGVKQHLKFILMYLMGLVTMVFICSFRFGKPFEVMISTMWYSTPKVFAIAKISLLFVSIVDIMFVLSQNPPIFRLVYPFHYQSHLSSSKTLFTSKSLEFSLRLIFYLAHTLSLVFVLISYIESRYECVGRKSYNLLHFIHENYLRKCWRRS
ncbi:polycystic kidney disease protein 1-like 2 [Nilaparvata lugens]|uniref:polycystic kidney disease protein 1-like 2 n=1 Tax=Nilaparvata lugens TaxID=108931 RepID=UPI00193EA128|nr:polycystic kidney disease protein 1-like 2 [Nilaparvata lugens]